MIRMFLTHQIRRQWRENSWGPPAILVLVPRCSLRHSVDVSRRKAIWLSPIDYQRRELVVFFFILGTRLCSVLTVWRWCLFSPYRTVWRFMQNFQSTLSIDIENGSHRNGYRHMIIWIPRHRRGDRALIWAL